VTIIEEPDMNAYNKFWVAVATLLLYLLAQFGLPLDETAADALSTIIVVLGPAFVWRVPNVPGPE